jgi:hypothetical protein
MTATLEGFAQHLCELREQKGLSQTELRQLLNQSLHRYVFLQPLDLGDGNACHGWCPREDFLHQANVLDNLAILLYCVKHSYLSIEHARIAFTHQIRHHGSIEPCFDGRSAGYD